MHQSVQLYMYIIIYRFVDRWKYVGPRYFNKKLNGILCAEAKYGTNNVVFLTITASPDWNGLLDLGGRDRVDAVTRAFEAIRQEVYQDLIEGKFCPPDKRCRAIYAMNVTEWQKCSLPHAHMIAHFPGPIWTPNDVRSSLSFAFYSCRHLYLFDYNIIEPSE
jgi:hypothetical protein